MNLTAEMRFTQLYRAHYDQVLAYCGRRVNRTDAEEVANEVFVVLWRKLSTVDGNTALPWLYGVAYRSLGDRFRGMRRRQKLSNRLSGLRAESADRPDEIVVRRAQDQMVIDALDGLRSTDAEILRLAAWEELTAPQIAVVVGCSVSAAEQRVHRAKKRLGKVLAARMPATTYPASLGEGGRQ